LRSNGERVAVGLVRIDRSPFEVARQALQQRGSGRLLDVYEEEALPRAH
jgi:hypothetical protein